MYFSIMKLLFLALSITVIYATDSANSDSSDKIIVNKVFCSCNKSAPALDLPAVKANKLKASSFLDVFRSIFHLNAKNEDAAVSSEHTCSKNKFLVKCENSKHRINIILASVGVHENKCFENNSTFESLHSSGKSLCHEALKSTQIVVEKCNDRNKCSISIKNDLGSICQSNINPKHLNIVYECLKSSDTHKDLRVRNKRFNKYEKDTRARNFVSKGTMITLPTHWQYDMLRPYSFRNNREAWGTGNYDYYNYFQYEDYNDYAEIEDILENDYYYNQLAAQDYYDYYSYYY